MKPILVITSQTDIHCDFVAKEIRNLGADIIRLNSDDFENNIEYNVSKYKQNKFEVSFSIKDSGINFNQNNFNVIWYRKPFPIKVKDNWNNQELTSYISDEHNKFVGVFYDLLKNKCWVNNIWANRKANFKLSNLEIADKIGLRTPNTIVTNIPEDAENFANKCNWKIITKPFSYSGFSINNLESYCPFANIVSKEEFFKFKKTIKLAPTFLQEYIDKNIEIRVTIIGNRVFSAAIHSQENNLSKYDFRGYDAYKLKHTIHQLPSIIEKYLLLFNKYFELHFSTFDLILTPENEYVFLECNPNGQWYWIEELTGMPIAKSIAVYLLKMNNT